MLDPNSGNQLDNRNLIGYSTVDCTTSLKVVHSIEQGVVFNGKHARFGAV